MKKQHNVSMPFNLLISVILFLCFHTFNSYTHVVTDP